MKACPTLSVIIPMLNAGTTVEAAVGSVLGARGVDVEAIVVDDGSTDDGPSRVAGLARRDPRIRLFTPSDRPGGGVRNVSSARNFGLQRAGGRYVMFLDADDEVDTEGPARLVARAERARVAGECAAAFGPMAMCDERMRPLGRTAAQASARLDEAAFVRSCAVCNGAHVLARELIGEERFDTDLRIAEDWDLWLRLAERGVVWHNVAGPAVARYRMRPGSATRDFRRYAADSVRMIEKASARRARGLGRVSIGAGTIVERRKHAAIELATRLALSGADPAECVSEAARIAGAGAMWTPTELGSIVGWSVMYVFGASAEEPGPRQEEWIDRALGFIEALGLSGHAEDVEACRRAVVAETVGPAGIARSLVTTGVKAGTAGGLTVVGLGANSGPVIEEARHRGLEVEAYDDDGGRVESWGEQVRGVEWERVVLTASAVIVSVGNDAGFASRLRERRGPTIRWSVIADELRAHAWGRWLGRRGQLAAGSGRAAGW